MAEYIKREDAIMLVEKGDNWPVGKVVDDILHLPTIDVAEARHGRWILIRRQAASAIFKCSDDIKTMPTIDAVPAVHGHPVYHNRPVHYEHYEMVQQTENGEPLYKRQYYNLQDNPVAYCSECGKRLCSRFTSYCPNCGADMREVEHG